MSSIRLESAQIGIRAALSTARALKLRPVTVAVLDAGGHVIALSREDNSSNLRPKIAIAKASGALALGISSRAIGDMAQERPSFLGAVSILAPDGIVPAAGGILVTGHDGNVVGAIGVTGDSSDNDEICALAAHEALKTS